MRAAALAAFFPVSNKLEGHLPYMYLDELGLVTTGIGDLIDPISVALALPWQIGGYAATQQEIGDQWTRVKGATGLEKRGGGAFASLTTVRLTEDAIDALVRGKAAEMEGTLRAKFTAWDSAPADAQLATILTAWAEGAYGLTHAWPRFDAAFLACDWATCASQCHLDETGNPGLVPRNAINRALFLAAQAVQDSGGDPDVLTGWSV
jgi:hypothetical protein